MVLCLLITGLLVVLGVRASESLFPLRNIVIYGNHHLSKEEIRKGIGVDSRGGLLGVSLREIDQRLRAMPWIKEVSIRKQFPDTLMIRVEEAVPVAILKYKDRLFLMDRDTKILEEIKSDREVFLPVISGMDPATKKKEISESLRLIDALRKEGMLSDRESVEIRSMPYGLEMDLDGETIRVGYGRYREKLRRWRELEAEIRKRGIAIEYVDLRFEGQVIVKPLEGKEVHEAGIKKKI